MEKIVIQKNGKPEEIVIQNLKGRHTKNGLKKLVAIRSENGTEDLSKLEEYLDYLDKVACECTGLSQDDIDNLDADEKNKIISVVQNKIMSTMDFLKSSLNAENLSEKEKAGP